MSDVPNIYLDDPDPLSVLLKALDLTAEVYVNGQFCGTWAVDTSGSRRIPFHLIAKGKAWLHLGDTTSQKLRERDLVVFPHDGAHIVSNSSQRPRAQDINQPMTNDGETTQMVCGFFEFHNPAIFPVLDQLPDSLIVRSGQGQTHARIESLGSILLDELAQARPGSYAAIDQIAFLVFLEVMRQQLRDEMPDTGVLRALFEPKLGPLLNAIHQAPERNWTLQTMAETAAMSRSAFAERFTQIVGAPPLKYLTAWRMTIARKLLLQSSFTAADIAERCGYESEAAFRKTFKKVLGETPGAVRKLAQKRRG